MVERLNLAYSKVCNCPSNHINCLSAKEWVKHQIAVWEFYYEKRDIRDKHVHPAMFPIALPKRCIELFTHEGELVLDPFVGSGSTLIAAFDLNRNAIGFDLKKEYVDLSNSRISNYKLDQSSSKQIAIMDDALNIHNYVSPGTVSLIVTSPPYANMLDRPRKNLSYRSDLKRTKEKHYMEVQQYSTDPRDLGRLSYTDYVKAMGIIFSKLWDLLKPKAHVVININDLWLSDVKHGRRVPTHSYLILELERVGYALRNVIIWDKRNLVNKICIFGYPNNYITLSITFEYILDFWRPA